MDSTAGILQVQPKVAVAMQPEAFWRHSELERRFETLDQEEHALHQSQMRLFREQMAAFIRDLELLRQELSATISENSSMLELVNDTREAHSRLDRAHHLAVDRMVGLEKSIQDSAERHDRSERQLEGIHEGCLSVAGRLESIEASVARHTGALSTVEAAHDKLASDIDSIMASLGRQALSYEDFKAKNASLLESITSAGESQTKVEKAQLATMGRLSTLERTIQSLIEQQELQGKHAEGAHEQVAAIAGRVGTLEALLSGSDNKHAQEIQQLRVYQDRHTASLDKLEGLHEHFFTAVTRIGGMEKLLNEELEQIKDTHARHTSDLADLKASQKRSADEMDTLRTGASELRAAAEQRLDLLESLAGEAAARHAKQLQEIMNANETHALSLADMKATHSYHTDLKERVENVEQLVHRTLQDHVEERLCNSASRFGHEVASLQAVTLRLETEVARFAKEEKARTLVQCSLADRLGNLEKTIDDKFDRMDNRLSVVRGIWARDREQLVGAYRQIDQITGTLQREVLVKDELSAESITAHDWARRREAPSEEDAPPPPPSCSLALASLSLRSKSCPRGLCAVRSTSPRSPCDWDEAVKRMQAEGIVRADTARVGRVSAAWS